MTTSENSLLERAGEYDAQTLAEIYDRYAEAIYRYLYRYLGDPAQAEDLTGDVFLKLLEVLGTRRAPRDQLQGWLYRVAHNLAMDWFRQESRAPAEELGDNLVADSDPPFLQVQRGQDQQRLRAAIRQLTRAQQQVILLRFGEEFKTSEVAELLGKSPGAVKILQHRAIQRLRKLLDQEGE